MDPDADSDALVHFLRTADPPALAIRFLQTWPAEDLERRALRLAGAREHARDCARQRALNAEVVALCEQIIAGLRPEAEA